MSSAMTSGTGDRIIREIGARLDKIENMITDLTRTPQAPEKTDMLKRFAKFIVQHKDNDFHGDHACKKCYPHSELAVSDLASVSLQTYSDLKDGSFSKVECRHCGQTVYRGNDWFLIRCKCHHNNAMKEMG